MKTVLLITTDGRWHCLRDTISSFEANMQWPFDRVVIMNDSGSKAYALQLSRAVTVFNGTNVEMIHHDTRRGQWETISEAWEQVLPTSDFDYVFHLEDDFTLDRMVLLGEMIEVLKTHPYLAQLCLMRQPWNELEKAAGGIWQKDPLDYTQKAGWFNDLGKTLHWYEHRHHFSLNPCLYPKWVVDIGWPHESEGEGKFAFKIWDKGPEYRSAYWGKMSETPIVTHTGVKRIGMGY